MFCHFFSYLLVFQIEVFINYYAMLIALVFPIPVLLTTVKVSKSLQINQQLVFNLV